MVIWADMLFFGLICGVILANLHREAKILGVGNQVLFSLDQFKLDLNICTQIFLS